MEGSGENCPCQSTSSIPFHVLNHVVWSAQSHQLFRLHMQITQVEYECILHTYTGMRSSHIFYGLMDYFPRNNFCGFLSGCLPGQENLHKETVS